jgi:hypothetical protein
MIFTKPSDSEKLAETVVRERLASQALVAGVIIAQRRQQEAVQAAIRQLIQRQGQGALQT